MNYRQEVGSYTAKGGFKNEADIVFKFNDYKNDNEAQLWLNTMGYNYQNIHKLVATQIPPRINKNTALSLGVLENNFNETTTFKKADIHIKLEVIVDKYKNFWNIPETVCETLKLYTGEKKPMPTKKTRDKRRMFLDEIEKSKVDKLISFFHENKLCIFSDVLRGRGALSADWLLVTKKKNNKIDWILKDMNFVCNFFAKGPIMISHRGNLKIGKMTVQRKGGTPDPESLQFKLNPLDLFDS